MNNLSEVDLEHIRSRLTTPLIRQVVNLIGLEHGMRLIEKRGGSRLYVPKKSKGSVLEQILGEQASKSLSERYATEIWEIPQEKAALALWLKYRYKYSVNDIVLKLKTSHHTVYRYLN